MADNVAQSKPANWQTSKNYYYWHGHEKNRAMEGDVAPMPTPVLVATDNSSPAPVSSPPQQVKRYSWSDSEKNVSIYVETEEQSGDVVDCESITVEWKKRSLNLRFAVMTAGGVTKKRQLMLHLHKSVQPESCTHKVKEASKQIYLRGIKAEPESWHELTGKPDKNNDSDDE